MHNGSISDFADIRRGMLDLLEKAAYENIHGTTDSEHLAALYMSNLTRNAGTAGGQSGAVDDKGEQWPGQGPASWERRYTTTEMLNALVEAFKAVVELQQRILGGPEKVKACSLNVCCTDGTQMVAVRLRNHAVEQPPSLYWSTQAGTTLNRKYPDLPSGGANPNASRKASDHGKHVIVASEPTTYKVDEWALIEKNHALVVDADGNHSIIAVDMPESLMALAATGNHF